MIIGGTRYNYVRNAQNDIVGLIDSTGKRVVYYKYDSWGRAVNISGTMAATVGQKNPFRYRGYYFDAESGMYYLQSRYYDPEIRRFISADAMGILNMHEDLYNRNLYVYCDGNAVSRAGSAGFHHSGCRTLQPERLRFYGASDRISPGGQPYAVS